MRTCTHGDFKQYVLLYLDNVLVISERAKQMLRSEIGKHFVLNKESTGPPSNYLDGKLLGVTLDNGIKVGHLAFANMSNLLSRMSRNIFWQKGGSFLIKLLLHYFY